MSIKKEQKKEEVNISTYIMFTFLCILVGIAGGAYFLVNNSFVTNRADFSSSETNKNEFNTKVKNLGTLDTQVFKGEKFQSLKKYTWEEYVVSEYDRHNKNPFYIDEEKKSKK